MKAYLKNMKTKKPILLVEDDTVDQLTVKRALKDSKVTNELFIVNNGEDGLAFLRTEDNQEPGIILLDLNMPRMNGLEFLKVVKKDDSLNQIPVVVLTTSNEESDKLESFKLGIAGYMTKPVDYMQFVEVVKTINGYWTLSEFPNG